MAEIQLFRDSNFLGGSISKTSSDSDLKNDGFNDVISSVIVKSGTFTLFQDVNFKGFSLTVCATGGPNSDGKYPNGDSLAGRGDNVSSLKKNSDNPIV